MEEARRKFGPLTSEPFHAVTILMEETGEVARALLEMRRAKTEVGRTLKRVDAVKELTQVMSVCAFMILNLDEEGLLRA